VRSDRGLAGQAPARQAAIGAGLPTSVGAVTVNKVCGSSIQTVIMAAQAIALGEAKILAAGGMESMTGAPYLLQRARQGYRLGHGELTDSLVKDGLWDVYNNFHMEDAGELCAAKYQFTRTELDDFALESDRRADPHDPPPCHGGAGRPAGDRQPLYRRRGGAGHGRGTTMIRR
jgi:acetyl-CoA C-acetyltransferase